MKKIVMVCALCLVAMAGCNTYKASEGNTSSKRVVGGVKQDAHEAGNVIERAAHGIGDAINKAVK